MTITLTLTHRQAKSLRHVYTQCLAMAERSPTVAALLSIEKDDIERVESVLETIPRLNNIFDAQYSNRRNLPTLPRLVPTQNQVSGANHTTPGQADPSAAHGDN